MAFTLSHSRLEPQVLWNYLPGLALNQDSPDLYLLSS
jgi:hypothetical protein